MSIPEPLTPPDCNLQNFHRMMLDVTRLRTSAFDATLNDSAWRAGLNLWMSAWHSVPAASLPDDDAALAKAAGLGRDVRTWKKLRAEALRNWVKCSDGLLYHPTVAELALEAWLEKLGQALSSGAGNAKRWGVAFDSSALDAEIDLTLALLASLNPKSKAISKAGRRKPKASQPDPDGTETASQRDTVSDDFSSQGNKNGTEELERPPTPPGGQEGEAEFLLAWQAYPIAGRATIGMQPAHKSWIAACRSVSPKALLAAVVAFAASESGRVSKPRRFDRWLADGAYASFLTETSGVAWAGPAEVREAFLVLGEAWCRSCLDQSGWQDVPERAIIPASSYAMRKFLTDGADIVARLKLTVLERRATA